MPEAAVIRFAATANLAALAARVGGTLPASGSRFAARRVRRGPESMPNNGRGRIPAARTADGTTSGGRTGRLTHSTAEGGPAAPFREAGRGQGVGAADRRGGPEPALRIGPEPTDPHRPADRV